MNHLLESPSYPDRDRVVESLARVLPKAKPPVGLGDLNGSGIESMRYGHLFVLTTLLWDKWVELDDPDGRLDFGQMSALLGTSQAIIRRVNPYRSSDGSIPTANRREAMNKIEVPGDEQIVIADSRVIIADGLSAALRARRRAAVPIARDAHLAMMLQVAHELESSRQQPEAS